MTKTNVSRATCLVLVSSFLCACSLPGLKLNDHGASSPWYKHADARYAPAEQPKEKDFKPDIFEITPRLVAKLNQTPYASTALTHTPLETKAFSDYQVGIGDVLAIIVYGHQDITNPAGTTQNVESSGRLVDAKGDIYVPFIGTINVAGRTVEDVRKEVTHGLAKVIREPQVDIKVLQYRSQKVYITGDINQPCAVSIQDIPLTIVDALAACQSSLSAGGADVTTTGVNAVKLVRAGEVYPINLSRLYQQGGKPVALQDDDRLIIDQNFNRIFVIGEFNKQIAPPYAAGGMSLADAMAAGGGLDLNTANAGGIYVIRGFVDEVSTPENGLKTVVRPRIYHLDASSVDALILADQFKIQPRDVVFAAPASLVNYNRALAQITPTLNTLFQTFLIYDRARRR